MVVGAAARRPQAVPVGAGARSQERCAPGSTSRALRKSRPVSFRSHQATKTHLHAPRTELVGADGNRATRYLRTSPEFAAKKLLAAGEPRIFEFARVFRDRERGDLHLPEIHHAGMVPRQRRLRRGDGRQRCRGRPCRAGDRHRTLLVSRPEAPILLPSRSC